MLSDGPLNCTFVLWKLETTLYDEVSGGVCEWHTEGHLKKCVHLTPNSTQVLGSDQQCSGNTVFLGHQTIKGSLKYSRTVKKSFSWSWTFASSKHPTLNQVV